MNLNRNPINSYNNNRANQNYNHSNRMNHNYSNYRTNQNDHNFRTNPEINANRTNQGNNNNNRPYRPSINYISAEDINNHGGIAFTTIIIKGGNIGGMDHHDNRARRSRSQEDIRGPVSYTHLDVYKRQIIKFFQQVYPLTKLL